MIVQALLIVAREKERIRALVWPLVIALFCEVLATAALPETGSGNGEFFHAISRPNQVMIGNNVDAALYIAKIITRPSDRPALERFLGFVGPCTATTSMSIAAEFVIELDGHAPFPLHSILISGPAGVGRDGQLMQAVSLAPKDVQATWKMCGHAVDGKTSGQ